MKRKILISIAGLMLSGVLFAGGSKENPAASESSTPPAWAEDIEKQFPDKDYVAVEGTGDTKREATENAREELSKRFKVSVSTSTVAEDRYRMLAEGTQKSDSREVDINTRTLSLSEQTLTNVKFSNTWTDKRATVHIVAYLVRKEASEQYRRLVGEDLKLIQGLKERAAKAPNAILKFAIADSTLLVANHTQGLIEQLDIINPTLARTFGGQLDLNSILAERDAAANQVRIKVEIDGDTDGKIAGITSKLLADFKLTTSKTGNASVSGSVQYDKDAARKADRKGVRWTLKLTLTDEQGLELTSMFKEQLEEAISEKEAMGFVVIEMEKAIKKEFAQKIVQFLTKSALGK